VRTLRRDLRRAELGPQRGEQLLAGEVEEVGLVGVADLDESDVGEPRIGVLAHGLDDLVEVRPARDRPADVLGPDELGGAGEPGRTGELGIDLPAFPNQRNCSCGVSQHVL
jgi:hypothetical protein